MRKNKYFCYFLSFFLFPFLVDGHQERIEMLVDLGANVDRLDGQYTVSKKSPAAGMNLRYSYFFETDMALLAHLKVKKLFTGKERDKSSQIDIGIGGLWAFSPLWENTLTIFRHQARFVTRDSMSNEYFEHRDIYLFKDQLSYLFYQNRQVSLRGELSLGLGLNSDNSISDPAYLGGIAIGAYVMDPFFVDQYVYKLSYEQMKFREKGDSMYEHSVFLSLGQFF